MRILPSVAPTPEQLKVLGDVKQRFGFEGEVIGG